MSDPKTDLTRTIAEVTDQWDEPLDYVHDITPIVNAILAAGWSQKQGTNVAFTNEGPDE